jgi:hypothetical protein
LPTHLEPSAISLANFRFRESESLLWNSAHAN